MLGERKERERDCVREREREMHFTRNLSPESNKREKRGSQTAHFHADIILAVSATLL